MSGPKLAVYVDVHDDDGVAHCFGPGDVPPAWAVQRIDRPDVWASTPAVGADTAESSPVGEPLRPGAGSRKDTWLAYAESLGINIAEGATKAEVIAAVAALDDPEESEETDDL